MTAETNKFFYEKSSGVPSEVEQFVRQVALDKNASTADRLAAAAILMQRSDARDRTDALYGGLWEVRDAINAAS